MKSPLEMAMESYCNVSGLLIDCQEREKIAILALQEVVATKGKGWELTRRVTIAENALVKIRSLGETNGTQQNRQVV